MSESLPICDDCHKPHSVSVTLAPARTTKLQAVLCVRCWKEGL